MFSNMKYWPKPAQYAVSAGIAGSVIAGIILAPELLLLTLFAGVLVYVTHAVIFDRV